MKKIQPVFSENYIPVVFSSSPEYAKYLIVAIKSLILSRSEKYNLDIIILHYSIEREMRDSISSEFSDETISVRFVSLSNGIGTYKFSVRDGYANESFYRIALAELMDAYEKVIYLDSDIIVMSDICELYNINNPDNSCIAAARDINGISASYINYENRKQYMMDFLKLKSLVDYFQSGVMVFFVKYIREKYCFDQMLLKACMEGIMFGDQDVLNMIFSGDVLYIDMKWNLIVDVDGVKFENQYCLAPIDILKEYIEGRKNPAIIHYAGTKPWKIPDCDYSEMFWKIARTTSCYKQILEELL